MKIEEISDIFDFFEKDEVLDYIGKVEVIDWLHDKNYPSDLLDYFDESDLVEYLSDSKFIADDSDEAIEILKDNGDLPDLQVGLDLNQSLPDSMMNPCVDLLQRIIDKEGYNYLYSILESEKEKLHII